VSEDISTKDKNKDEEVFCLHCGLSVPEYRKHFSQGNAFCCGGCEAVYSIISEHNMGYYYQLQENSKGGGIPAANPQDTKELQWFDSSEFQELHVRLFEEFDRKIASTELFLEGVHCPACVWLLERLPEMNKGIRSIRVDLGRSTAEICYFPDKITLSSVASTLTRFGYRPHPFRGRTHAALRKKVEHSLLSSLGIAGASAGNSMLLSICLYSGTFGGEEGSYWHFFRWISFLITIPSVWWSGRIFYKRALAALSLGHVHLDVPISLGVITAFIGSSINTIRGSGEIYFDSINAILFLLLTSRFLQFRAQHKANEKAELLFSLLPSHVHVIENGRVEDRSLDEVQVGDRIEVRGGETIPVDGTVVEGDSLVDCSVLTGESVPIPVKLGTMLHAGMQNTVSPLIIKVKSTGEQTRIGRLSQLATDMHRSKPVVLHLVDRVSKWFVLLVLILAGIGFLLGLQVSLEEAFERMIALLIISCPCALGMATPLALSVGLGNAARAGIHLRSTAAIELITKCRTIVFDKTGTLTKGKFEVHAWWGDRKIIPYIYALEKHSSHVIARSLQYAYESYKDDSLYVEEVFELPGRGIRGMVNDRKMFIGNAQFFIESDIFIGDETRNIISEYSVKGLTPILVGFDSEITGIIGLGDPFHHGAKEILDRIQRRGFKVYLLSGDHKKVVTRAAEILSVPVKRAFGEMDPEAKVSKVIEIQKEEPLILFGDGTNDAAALASAAVGIAVHGGAEASFLIADGFFSRPDLRLIERLIYGSRNSMSVVSRGLMSSLFFNLFGCGLAVFGYVSPLIAALLMPISSLIVVFLAFSQRSFLNSEH
jgi:P-type Cu2+ transporter